MGKTKRYVAVTGKRGSGRILAGSESEARRCIREQLDRPGRRQVFKRWRDGGERIDVEEESRS